MKLTVVLFGLVTYWAESSIDEEKLKNLISSIKGIFSLPCPCELSQTQRIGNLSLKTHILNDQCDTIKYPFRARVTCKGTAKEVIIS